MATALALLSAALAALTPFILKPVSGRLNHLWLNALKLLAGFLVLTPFALISARALSPKEWLLSLLTALFGPVLAWLLYLGAIKRGDVSEVVPVANSYPVLALALDFAFRGVRPSLCGVAGAVGVVAGLWLLYNPRAGKAWFFALGTASLWGVNSVLFKELVVSLPPLEATWMRAGVAGAASLGLAAAFGKGELRKFSLKDFVLAAVAGVNHDALMAGLFILSLTLGEVYQVAPASATTPLFALLLGGAFLRERITLKKALGAVAVVLGVVLTAF